MTTVLGTDLDSPNILRANATERTAPRATERGQARARIVAEVQREAVGPDAQRLSEASVLRHIAAGVRDAGVIASLSGWGRREVRQFAIANGYDMDQSTGTFHPRVTA